MFSIMNLDTYLKARKAIDLARDIGVSSALISQWANGVRRVPAERCPQIERATAGAVRCEDLRPDIDWAILRAHQERAA